MARTPIVTRDRIPDARARRLRRGDCHQWRRERDGSGIRQGNRRACAMWGEASTPAWESVKLATTGELGRRSWP